jgi:hypothetical protein
MDSNALAAAGVSSSAVAILFIIYKVVQKVIGHRIVSNCCGRRMEVGIDVRDMPNTPEELSLESESERRSSTFLETSSHLPHHTSSEPMKESHLRETKGVDNDSESHSQRKNSTTDIPHYQPPLLEALKPSS